VSYLYKLSDLRFPTTKYYILTWCSCYYLLTNESSCSTCA